MNRGNSIICTSCIVLKSGHVDFQGPAAKAITHYSQGSGVQEDSPPADTEVILSHLRINGQTNGIYEPILPGTPFDVEADFHVGVDLATASFYCVVFDSKGDGIIYHHVDLEGLRCTDLASGKYHIWARIPPCG